MGGGSNLGKCFPDSQESGEQDEQGVDAAVGRRVALRAFAVAELLLAGAVGVGVGLVGEHRGVGRHAAQVKEDAAAILDFGDIAHSGCGEVELGRVVKLCQLCFVATSLQNLDYTTTDICS